MRESRERETELHPSKPPCFDVLYRTHCDRIYRFCFRLTGNSAEAEDLAQDVFVLAYRSLGRFEGRSSPATWLYRIAVRRWERVKQGRRLETVPFDEEMSLVGANDPAQSSLDRMSLESAFDALPDPLRVAFLLVKSEGLKCREAAEVLGIPEGTLKSRVHDAVARLQSILVEEGREGAGGHETRRATARKRSRTDEL